MNREVKHRMGRSAGVPPEWTSVLAVIPHPDDASFGLGAILDAFVFAGAKVEVLCLTHGQAWTLEGAPGDLAALREAELASAADVLGPTRAFCPGDNVATGPERADRDRARSPLRSQHHDHRSPDLNRKIVATSHSPLERNTAHGDTHHR